MKYYLYISTAKLDRLADQLPEPTKQKYAAEFGIDWGIAKGKVSAELEPPGLSRKLNAVAHYLIAEKNSGQLQDAREWVLDRLSVKHVAVSANPDIFLLVRKKDGMIHCLGGSGHHVIGNRRGANVDVGYSYFPEMAKALSTELGEEGISNREMRERFYGKDNAREEFASIRTHEWADVIRSLYEWNDLPTFEVGFLARFLVFGRSLYGEYCTICSPLYVELK